MMNECYHLSYAYQVSQLIKSSLGPVSRDKLIVRPNGELVVTCDGRTMLEQIFQRRSANQYEEDVDLGRWMNRGSGGVGDDENGLQLSISSVHQHQARPPRRPIFHLMVQLSKNQDVACGDGTTSVVILCGEMCYRAIQLIQKGIHPLTIREGYKIASEFAIRELENLLYVNELKRDESDAAQIEQAAHKAAKTSLGTKVVSRDVEYLAEMCVNAVKLVSSVDADRKLDIQLRYIAMEHVEHDYIGNESLNNFHCAELVRGVSLKKSFSHESMPNEMRNARIAVLSCALEPPKLKTKHTINITNREEFDDLRKVEQSYFQQIFDKLSEMSVNTVICQWGMDHEVNEWLYQNGMVAVRWVPGHELERVAMAVGAQICSRITDLQPHMIGTAERIYQKQNPNTTNSSSSQIVVIEGCINPKVCTILIHAINQLVADDIKRSLFDAMCSIRDCMTNSQMLVGGGATECQLYLRMKTWAEQYIEEREQDLQRAQQQDGSHPSEFQTDHLYQLVDVLESWISSLLCIPLILSENSGVANSVGYVQDLLQLHRTDPQEYKSFGVGLNSEYKVESMDMSKLELFETLKMKSSILRLATEMTCTILKIDKIVQP